MNNTLTKLCTHINLVCCPLADFLTRLPRHLQIKRCTASSSVSPVHPISIPLCQHGCLPNDLVLSVLGPWRTLVRRLLNKNGLTSTKMSKATSALWAIFPVHLSEIMICTQASDEACAALHHRRAATKTRLDCSNLVRLFVVNVWTS